MFESISAIILAAALIYTLVRSQKQSFRIEILEQQIKDKDQAMEFAQSIINDYADDEAERRSMTYGEW